LEKGDLGGFKNLQTEGIYGKRYTRPRQIILPEINLKPLQKAILSS
jgi:hypothetical protein